MVEASCGFVKLNSDGSALSNPGKIGAGVIIKDSEGNLIPALANPLGEGTNNLVETITIILVMKWCLENGFSKIHLEVDSALLIQWLNNSAEPPWNLENNVQDLRALYRQYEDFKCSHVYKETNFPADSLSKLNHDLPAKNHSHKMTKLPTTGLQFITWIWMSEIILGERT